MSNSNTSFKKSSSRSDDVDKEVNILMKKYANEPNSIYLVLKELHTLFKDEEIVDNAMKKYTNKKNRIIKLAEKIKERLVSKYPNLTMKEYIEKISEYKKKYEFDDSEMQTILNLIFLSKSTFSNPDAFDVNYNEMSKALGFVPASYNLSGKLKVKEGEERNNLQLILNGASFTKELHDQVTLQSLIYTDCDPASISTDFDKNKINIFSFIHPVVAALFIPKFELLDQHIILASIAKIIAYKANNQDLQTQPEYELYWDIATDPAETACVNKTKPFTDLLHRCNVQIKLWEAILNLRQGKYYTNDLTSFIQAIDNCKASVFDAADLAYVKDEGTIMRKLLAAFSIRPTIVITMPVYGITPLTSHISSVSSSQITTLSMITMRIPMSLGMKSEPIDINSALNQEQLYIHHRQLTVKQQQILYSRELLIFYIHRRYQSFNTSKLTNPYTISYLPITMNQFEKLQDAVVSFTETIFIPSTDKVNQTFNLKSVVCVETKDIVNDRDCDKEIKNQLIVSCSALIRPDDSKKMPGDSLPYAYKYNPLELKSSGNNVKAMDFIGIDEFTVTVQTKGTIFIFQTKDKVSDPLSIY